MSDTQGPQDAGAPGQDRLLYLSSADVEAIGLSPGELRTAIADAIRQRRAVVDGGRKMRVQVD